MLVEVVRVRGIKIKINNIINDENIRKIEIKYDNEYDLILIPLFFIKIRPNTIIN